MIELSRLMMYLNIIVRYSYDFSGKIAFSNYFYNCGSLIVMFSKIILGFFQMESIAQLAIRINKKFAQQKVNISRIIKIVVFLINLTVLIAMIFEIFLFLPVLNYLYETRIGPAQASPAGLQKFE